MLRNQKNGVSLHRDIDVNRASPREEGVDVFNVTFFYVPCWGLRVFLFQSHRLLLHSVCGFSRLPNNSTFRVLWYSSRTKLYHYHAWVCQDALDQTLGGPLDRVGWMPIHDISIFVKNWYWILEAISKWTHRQVSARRCPEVNVSTLSSFLFQIVCLWARCQYTWGLSSLLFWWLLRWWSLYCRV